MKYLGKSLLFACCAAVSGGSLMAQNNRSSSWNDWGGSSRSSASSSESSSSQNNYVSGAYMGGIDMCDFTGPNIFGGSYSHNSQSFEQVCRQNATAMNKGLCSLVDEIETARTTFAQTDEILWNNLISRIQSAKGQIARAYQRSCWYLCAVMKCMYFDILKWKCKYQSLAEAYGVCHDACGLWETYGETLRGNVETFVESYSGAWTAWLQSEKSRIDEIVGGHNERLRTCKSNLSPYLGVVNQIVGLVGQLNELPKPDLDCLGDLELELSIDGPDSLPTVVYPAVPDSCPEYTPCEVTGLPCTLPSYCLTEQERRMPWFGNCLNRGYFQVVNQPRPVCPVEEGPSLETQGAR